MEAGARTRRLTAVRREEARVTALELFFDLVFVLAVTQCTALMANDATWQGLFRGLLVLAVLWWPWSGYAWLTSVVDPEEGAVRIAMFAAMAAFLVSALAVPNAFGDDALAFATPATISAIPTASREASVCRNRLRDTTWANRISISASVRTLAAVSRAKARNHICDAKAPVKPASMDGRQRLRIAISVLRSKK